MLLDAHLIKRIIIDEIAKIDFETNISIKGNLSISIDNNDCYLVDIKEVNILFIVYIYLLPLYNTFFINQGRLV